MFSTNWALSQREFTPLREAGVKIPLPNGTVLNADVIRPDADGTYPVILSVHAYSQQDQSMPMTPVGFSHDRGHLEAGHSDFFARRGYVHVIANVTGTGESTGEYDNLGPQTISDLCDAIQWLSEQPWSSGRVGMFGISYFAIVQPLVAARGPEALKTIFAPYGYTDMYRDRYYHGGILNHRFVQMWLPTLAQTRLPSELHQTLDADEFQALLDAARKDEEIASVPYLAKTLAEPTTGNHGLFADVLMQPLDNDYYRMRSVDYSQNCSIPGYFGACWGVYGLHLPGGVRSYENWNGPKKLTIGPPVYLDRPFYQYHLEALRWFDHWLKDNDTGMMDEPEVSLFMPGAAEWIEANQWPLPKTRFTQFFLHENGELSERDYQPEEGFTSFFDSPYQRGDVKFWSAPIVEKTQIAGPISLQLYGRTTETDVLWFVSLIHRDAEGHETTLTRGWLRGSQRALDPERSKPWQPYHSHDKREPLEPGETYRFDIEVRPCAIELQPGEQLGLRITCADTQDTPANKLEAISLGHMARPQGARVTVLHDADHPSALVLPIIAGNRIGTFVSGGKS